MPKVRFAISQSREEDFNSNKVRLKSELFFRSATTFINPQFQFQ